MGYSARVHAVGFGIPREKQHEALQAVKAELRAGKRFAYINIPDALKAPTLDAMLEEWGWGGEYDDDSNLTRVYFEAEKLGGERYLWQALAPFVDAGSYIEMVGEDGERWRWCFDGQTMQERRPTVAWE